MLTRIAATAALRCPRRPSVARAAAPSGVIVRLLPDWRRPKVAEEVNPVTREKLLWETAIDDVRTQIRVVNALRRPRVHHHL